MSDSDPAYAGRLRKRLRTTDDEDERKRLRAALREAEGYALLGDAHRRPSGHEHGRDDDRLLGEFS